MLLLHGQFKKKKKKVIRQSVKLLWQMTNNIQSLRTEEMQFACFVKVGKKKTMFYSKMANKKCHEVCLAFHQVSFSLHCHSLLER